MTFNPELEWQARQKAGLPKYHSVNQSDIGFRFTQPTSSDPGIRAFLAGDYEAMEAAWHSEDDVRTCVTFQTIQKQPLEELPPVQTLSETPPGFLAWLSCDAKYFAQFGAKLLATIDGPAHVHLMDGDPAYAQEVINYLKRPIGLTVEQPDAGPSYYHAVRFCRFAQLLRQRNEPSVLLDVDALANRPVTDLPKVPIGMRLRPGRLEPWSQCNASVVIGSADAQTYFDGVADYIFHFWKQGKLRWQIDQAALFVVWKQLGVDIHTLGETEVDYDYSEDGIVWCNSGRTKWDDNEPGRKRFIEASVNVDIPSATAFAHAKRQQEAEQIVYLPCELKGRDLDGRLLIAKHLCAMGLPVVVGHFWGLNGNMGRSSPGCYLFTTANDVQAQAMQRALTESSYVVASDSEGLPLANPLPNVSSVAVSLCDAFLVDSPVHQSILEGKFGTGKFILTGSPRIEYLINADVPPVGGAPYILFNTGLGVINSVWGSPPEALRAMSSAMEVSETGAQKIIDAETAALELISPLIRWLAPQHRVVIRPHPSENANAWREAFPSLEVIEGSSSIQWIKHAEVVIHANSTTGLEAVALGTPALNLNPVPEWGEQFVIHAYNYTVRTLEDAHAALSMYLGRSAGPLTSQAEGLQSLRLDGAQNTAQYLAELLSDAKPVTQPFTWTPVERTDQHRSKFSVTPAELKKKIHSLGNFGVVTQLDDSTFLLWPKNPSSKAS